MSDSPVADQRRDTIQSWGGMNKDSPYKLLRRWMMCERNWFPKYLHGNAMSRASGVDTRSSALRASPHYPISLSEKLWVYTEQWPTAHYS